MRTPACFFVLLTTFVLATAVSGCRFPRDPEGTLERIRGGVLQVGVAVNPPWTSEGPGNQPVGIEADMVRALARDLGADVEWHWSSEEEIIAALQAYQLDLGIGGVVEAPWLTHAVATSQPFFRSRVTVGFLPGQPIPEVLNDVVVTVPVVNDVGGILKDKGARIRHAKANRPAADALAGPAWWLYALGYEPGPWQLRMQRHVWLLPSGENGWIMTVERHLATYQDIDQALREAVER